MTEAKIAVSTEFKWYVVYVHSGFEHRVVKSLKDRIQTHKLQEHFGDILLPEETIVANVKGKKRNMKKKFFPGYLLINMCMNEKTWHLVKNTDKISAFVGGEKNRPLPISDDEANQLIGQLADGFKKTKPFGHFSEGDNVKVIEGPFTSFVGIVESVNEKGKVKVQVSIFGRPTPVELEFSQVEKI